MRTHFDFEYELLRLRNDGLNINENLDFRKIAMRCRAIQRRIKYFNTVMKYINELGQDSGIMKRPKCGADLHFSKITNAYDI